MVKKKVSKKTVEKVVKHGFVFIGNGNSDPLFLNLYGHTFKLNGDPVEIHDPAAVARLRNNNHFKEV